MKFFTRYEAPPSPSVEFQEASLTRQEFLAESDVNRLVERFRDTGAFYDPLTLVKSSQNKPFFADCTNIPDYQSALNIVIDAEDRFASLPSKVRDRFHNSPQELLDFVSNAKNKEEAISLGLLPKSPDKSPEKSPEKSPDKPPQAAS